MKYPDLGAFEIGASLQNKIGLRRGRLKI